MTLQILNPLEIDDWDELLLTHPDYSFFHTSAWARVLHESYGYKPLYFTAIENGRLSALIPIMEVNSFLTGRPSEAYRAFSGAVYLPAVSLAGFPTLRRGFKLLTFLRIYPPYVWRTSLHCLIISRKRDSANQTVSISKTTG